MTNTIVFTLLSNQYVMVYAYISNDNQWEYIMNRLPCHANIESVENISWGPIYDTCQFARHCCFERHTGGR